MAKYHINSKGNPAVCRATKGKCPFGGADQHFGSIQEATTAAEKLHEQEAGASVEDSLSASEDGFCVLSRRETFHTVEETVSHVGENGVTRTYLRKKSVDGLQLSVTYMDKDGREDCDGTFPSFTLYSKPTPYWGDPPKKLKETYSVHGVMYREGDLPSGLRWNEDGDLVHQAWTNKLGEIDRNGDKPAEIDVDEFGSTIEFYKRGGLLMREDDKPAVVERNSAGVIMREEWYQDGVLHRIGAPASISYHNSGQIHTKEWFQNGVWTRDDGPARELFTEDGKKSFEEWVQNGKSSRVGGPAQTSYWGNGQPQEEVYLRDGFSYREDGLPTMIKYAEDGTVVYEDYLNISSLKHYLDQI